MAGEWQWVSLGDVSVNHDARRIPVREADRKPGPYPYYGASGVVDHVNGFLFDGEYLLVAEDGENLRTRQTPVAFIARGQFWVNNHAHILQGSASALTRFLHYALTAADIRPFLTGAVMPKLTQANLHRIPILLPSRREQENIVQTLGALDDKIELNHQMAKTLEAMARALFKSWFVDFDPVNAKAEGHPSGLPADLAALFPDNFADDGLPRGWHIGKLLEHARLISGGTPKTDVDDYWGGSIPWASAADVSQCKDVFLIRTERTITERGLNESATQIIPELATVIVARGATTGRFCIFGRDMAMNQTCYALAAARNVPFWLNCSFASAVKNIVQAAHGSVFDTITTRTLEAARIVVPSEAIIDSFERVVSPIFKRILCVIEEALSLATLRDTLLPRLISGELRIADAEKRIVAA